MKTSSNFQFFCADMNFKKVFVQRSTLPKKILRKHSIEKKGLPKTKFDRINWKPWNILSSDSIVKIYRHGELWPKYAVPNQTILIHGFSKDHGPLCHFAVTSKTCCELRGHQVIIFHHPSQIFWVNLLRLSAISNCIFVRALSWWYHRPWHHGVFGLWVPFAFIK